MARDPYHHPCWPALRIAILNRDGWTCQLQLDGCTTRAKPVDHIKEWTNGGAWFDPANLQAACTHCNSVKGAMYNNARRGYTRTRAQWQRHDQRNRARITAGQSLLFSAAASSQD